MQFPAVIATDTLYGLVAPALDPKAMRRLKELKGRPKGKPFIILISSISELQKFKIKLTTKQERVIKTLWPPLRPGSAGQAVSIVLGRQAFRVPYSAKLRRFLKKTGPLAAPSANPAGQTPARTIAEAKQYFGDQVTTYQSGRIKGNQPSTLISLSKTGRIRILRQGVAVIPTNKVE